MQSGSYLVSDLLEEQFGSCNIEILSQDERKRLVAVSSAGRVIEIAYTKFVQNGVKAFPEVHQTIIDGESMGRAFKIKNVDFYREVRLSKIYPVSGLIAGYFGNENQSLRLIVVDIYVGAMKAHYAQITEIFAPDVRLRS